jgi:hypothetical protein
VKTSPTTGALMPRHGFSKVAARDPRVTGTPWRSADGLLVVSQLADMNLPGSDHLVGPTWLVSVSRAGRRASGDDLMRVIRAFEMPAWDEDNHHPGIARHLFCPVAEQWRNVCDCKITETTITDADGYQWTTDDRSRCRGCQYDEMVTTLTGRRAPCPLHSRRTR